MMAFVSRSYRGLGLTCLIAALMSASLGCNAFQRVGTTEWLTSSWVDQESKRPVSHVLSRWENNVRTTSNNQAGGAPLVGLAGRVYLMDESTGQGVSAQGDLLVQLYDMTNVGPNSPPQKILEVLYDPASLKQVKRKDLIGEGYTLFLPWENYNPAVKKVQVQVSYQPKNAAAHFSDPTVVSLQTEQPLPYLAHQNVIPAAFYQQNKGGTFNQSGAKAPPTGQ